MSWNVVEVVCSLTGRTGCPSSDAGTATISRRAWLWRRSRNNLDEVFCVEALDEALAEARPEIFNTDQGVQFTGRAFTGLLKSAGVAISMDDKGRALDNVFVERLWPSVKYEEVYLKDYEEVADCRKRLGGYFPSVLQPRTSASAPGQLHAVGSVPRQTPLAPTRRRTTSSDGARRLPKWPGCGATGPTAWKEAPAED